jgi:hypothetical protein
MKRIGATLALASALSLIVWQGVASASGKLNVNWTMHGSYTCIPPTGPNACANTVGSGTAHADSSVLGAMTWTNAGGGGNGEPACLGKLGGVTVSETWVFTTQSGDSLDLTTDSDSLCFVSKQVATESATFHITGGTGSLKDASGTGTFTIIDLTSPSNENGTFSATIDLP